MASAQISATIRPAYVWTGSEWVQIGDGGSSSEGGSSISVSASAPVSAVEGSAWFDNTDGKFYVYDGSFWVESAPTDAAYASYNRWTKVLSGSASMITGVADNGVTLDYTPGQESVYINGIFIDRDSYTASSGSAISFDEIVFSGDVIEVVWLDNIAIVDITNIYTKTEQDNLFLTQVSASNTYTTLTQFNNIDLTSTINTASAAAYASASAYTNSASSSLVTYTNTQVSAGINTASAAAVNYLIDSAPGTLDTLNELSAALNDDPNFYSTIQSVYLTQSNASATYLSQSSASTIYEKLIPYSTSTPSSPATGDMWVDSNTVPPALKVYTGSAWVQLGAAVDDSQAIIAGRMFA